MTDTTIADAVAYALDDGIASISDGAELMNSAGYTNALATHIHGAYVRDGSLPFTTVDTSNNLLDVGPGRAFVTVSGVEVQSDRSNAIEPSYDTTLPANVIIGVTLPSEVTDLGLDAGENDVWVAVDSDGSSGAAGDVYLRHGSGLSQPADPSVQLGTVDAGDGSTTRANDRATPTVADAAFPDIGGSPRFSTHDHSEAGLSTVPNAGLANDAITRSAGDGLSYSSGSAAVPLGGAATLTVDAALEYIRSNGSTISGQLADLGTNPGTFGALVDATVDDTSAAGTPHSFTFALDAATLLDVYAESDGAGGVQNLQVTLPELARVGDDIVATGGTTIWDSANGVVPQAQLGGPASSLSAYPLTIGDLDSPYPPADIAGVNGYPFQNSDLANDSVTVSGGNGVKNGGSVALGGSLTLDVEPADVAGTLLSDDGSDALAVDESNIDHDNIDQSTVSADDHHDRDHSARHGVGANDELATALRYEPQSEPSTPTSGVVRWYDSTDDAFRVKFDDGATATLAEK
jgi:hypothetical protein